MNLSMSRHFRKVLPMVCAVSIVTLGAQRTDSETLNETASIPSANDLRKAYFFAHEIPPKNFDRTSQKIEDFIALNNALGRKVAIVTSGGTSVPLEENTVRSISNFSTGHRGATMAQNLLRQGYSVVFLHKTGSKLPFLYSVQDEGRKLLHSLVDKNLVHPESHTTAPGHINDTTSVAKDDAIALGLPDNFFTCGIKMASLGSEAAGYLSTQRLIFVEYDTVSGYLHLLREACSKLRTSGANGLVVLAAAVSDFYIPRPHLSKEKIDSRSSNTSLLSAFTRFIKQSKDASLSSNSEPDASDGDPGPSLYLPLWSVPKLLPDIKRSWCPEAFVISFKLETDSDALAPKSVRSLFDNHVDAVVSNHLYRRKDEVHIWSRLRPGKTSSPLLNDYLRNQSTHTQGKEIVYNADENAGAPEQESGNEPKASYDRSGDHSSDMTPDAYPSSRSRSRMSSEIESALTSPSLWLGLMDYILESSIDSATTSPSTSSVVADTVSAIAKASDILTAVASKGITGEEGDPYRGSRGTQYAPAGYTPSTGVRFRPVGPSALFQMKLDDTSVWGATLAYAPGDNVFTGNNGTLVLEKRRTLKNVFSTPDGGMHTTFSKLHDLPLKTPVRCTTILRHVPKERGGYVPQPRGADAVDKSNDTSEDGRTGGRGSITPSTDRDGTGLSNVDSAFRVLQGLVTATTEGVTMDGRVATHSPLDDSLAELIVRRHRDYVESSEEGLYGDTEVIENNA